MDYEHYQGSVASLKKLNKYLLIAVISLCVVLVGMCAAVYRAIGHKSTVLVPPVLTQQMTISDVMPDKSYLNQMALYLILLRLNVTPDNAQRNFKAFLSHVNSRIYGQMAASLDEDKKAIQQSRITSAFYPSNQEINPQAMSVKITGRLDKYVGKRSVSSKQETYVMTFDYHNGTLSILDYYKLKK